MPQPPSPSDPSSSAGRNQAPAGVPAPAAPAPMSPGDEAPPGTPGTGENLCRRCGGSGTLDGKPCAECSGTGRVTVGIGGA